MAGKGNITKAESEATNFKNRPDFINKTGANRKTTTWIEKELEAAGIKEASEKEIIGIYLRCMNLTIVELRQIVTDGAKGDNPSLLSVTAKAIVSGKGLDIIEKIVDRAYGKPLLKQSLQNPDGTPVQIALFKLPDNDRG